MKLPTIMVVVASLVTAATLSVVPVSVSVEASTAHIGLIETDGSLREQTSAPQSEFANARTDYTQKPNDGTEPEATINIAPREGIDIEKQSAPQSGQVIRSGAAAGSATIYNNRVEIAVEVE